MRRTPARAIFNLVAASLGGSRKAAVAANDVPAAANAVPPSDDRRFMVAAEVHAMSGSTGRAVAIGGNFHEVTAALLTQGALWLAAGSVVAGVHSPATAFEPHALLDSLAADGVVWTQT